MKFRCGPPENRQSEDDREHDHVEERNDEKLRRIGGAVQRVELCHRNAGWNSDDGYGYTETDAAQAQLAVQLHIARPNQYRLDHQQDNPREKDRSVKIENERARIRRMDEVAIDCVAEAIDHDGRDNERHDEVEVAVEQIPQRAS